MQDLVKAKSYSLSNLSQTLLKTERPELDLDMIPQYFGKADSLAWLTWHCENDSQLAMRLVFQLMVLPLTKQLTNLAGNLWGRTLCGGRAERNELLLLHEFYRHEYVVPDKEYAYKKPDPKNQKKKDAAAKQATQVANEEEDDDDGLAAKQLLTRRVEKHVVSGRRKPAYAGGLVLEPKKGLYDKYVLMLDFNSLYPSIIQEYNICFTTVDRKLVRLGDNNHLLTLLGCRGRRRRGGRDARLARYVSGTGNFASAAGNVG